MKIFVIAGPNGAGKTTFARFFLKDQKAILHYLNADVLAAGLAPLHPEIVAVEAGRMLLTQMDHLAKQRASFAFETTLSSQNYLSRVLAWRKMGYHVQLVFLRLSNPEFAITRVQQRVKQGGHNIPEAVIRRRFIRGLSNLERYKKIVNSWQVLDNTAIPAILIDEGENES